MTTHGSGAAPRAGLSILARTFVLLAAALVVALAGAVALLVFAPVRAGNMEVMQVVALLSSRMPSGDSALHVYDSATRPQPPAGLKGDARVQAGIARWLDADADAVVFASTRRVHLRGGPRGQPPDGNAGERPPPPPPDGRACEPDCAPPPGGPDRPPPGDRPAPMDGPPPDGLAPDTLLRGDFLAAVRRADGQWRVVESSRRGVMNRVGQQAGLFFLGGLLVMLPIAWWFSRALAAPIREFARAADHLGRNPQAAPLPLQGPREVVRAAESFNTMRTRLDRMVAERTQMVGAIAHDLRTPLARLAFRLEKLPDDDHARAQADIDEMKAMISSALDFLRDQSRPGVRERLDLRSLVESLVDGLADTGLDVQLEPSPSAIVSGDPIALRRVIANLLDNALKYGQRARVRLVLHPDECRIEVDDDGPGIDPAQAESLFMPFARGDASRNKETGGIGLGLAVAQGIVVGHGGRITLHNRDTGGLRVIVAIPLA